MSSKVVPEAPQYIDITPLLTRLWPSPGDNKVTAEEIAEAISYIFTDQLSPVQTGALLTCLHFTGWDRRADVIAKCAKAMRAAASQVNKEELDKVVKSRGRREGDYFGGLVSCFQFIKFQNTDNHVVRYSWNWRGFSFYFQYFNHVFYSGIISTSY